MKNIPALCVMVAGVFLNGCAAGKNGLTLAPVGPAQMDVATANSNPNLTDGTLIVYSAYDVNADFNRRDSNRPEYSDYEIFTAGGKLLQRVSNDSGTILQDPAQVELPAGKYRVAAHANGYGTVTIPVVIAANRVTTLHLEGGDSWPNESAFNSTNAVRLPDGEIVGWRTAQ